jgi:predicted ATPase
MLFSAPELRAAVGSWTAQHLDGWRVDVRQNLDVFQITVRRAGRESNIGDSGQGLQQVLPVAALCCARKLRCGHGQFLDVVEQPELHLHDAAHAPIGDLLLSATSGGQGRMVVETHSESLVLRVRRRVAEGLSPDQVSIVFVEDLGDRSTVRNIRLDQSGDVDWWPEGVFSEAFMEVKAIRRAQRRRAVG